MFSLYLLKIHAGINVSYTFSLIGMRASGYKHSLFLKNYFSNSNIELTREVGC